MNMIQDEKSIGVYFTKLKGVWEELCNFRPNCSCGKCTCGGVKDLNSFLQNEYVMQFLMGLNESFTHTRGQVLLMDPIPPINKVFAMVSQEEKQRSVGIDVLGGSDQTNSMIMAVKEDQKRPAKKDRPLCTHCKMLGHTVDKCFKLHGYPPGYKPKVKGQANASEGGNLDQNGGSQFSSSSTLTDQQIHQMI